jgi:hypothetical protein
VCAQQPAFSSATQAIDTEAGRNAGAHTVGCANKSGKASALTVAAPKFS